MLKVKFYFSDFIALLIAILTLSEMFTSMGLGSFWGFLDEIMAIICIPLIGLGMLKGRYNKIDWLIILASILLLFIGLLGNIIYKYRTDIYLISLDVLATFKGVFYYLGFKALQLSSRQSIRIINGAARLFFVLMIVLIPFALLNLVTDIGMGSEYVFGIRAFKFVFSGAGNCSLIFYVIISVIIFKTSIQKKYFLWDKIYLVAALFLWTATLRSRAIAFVVIFLALAIFVFYLNRKRLFKIRLWYVLLTAIVVLFIAYDKIILYFQNENTARYNLLYYGFVTLKNCFPIGSGFATYGSAVAADYYSPLYWEYGFNNIHGLSPGNTSFSSDGLWGEVLGQFGLLGTICFCFIFLAMFIYPYRKAKDNYDKFAYLYVGIILLLGSIGTKTVMHFVISPIFILLPLKLKVKKDFCYVRELNHAENNGFYPHVQPRGNVEQSFR